MPATLGDLNVAAETLASGSPASYATLCAQLNDTGRPFVDVARQFADVPAGTSDALDLDASSRIDYIFLAPSQNQSAQLHPHAFETLPLDDVLVPEGSLSDHAAVACRARYLTASIPPPQAKDRRNN